MSDSVVYKGAPPPPPSAKVRAQRKRQRKLVVFTLAGLLVAVAVWQVAAYVGSAASRAAQEVERGMAFMTPNHYQEAIPYFTQALEIYPNSADAYYQRAVAKVNLGQSKEAAEDFQRALDIQPFMVESSAALAEIYRQTGDYQGALKELNRTIDRKPTVEAYYGRATVYAELGEHEKAIADYTWLIQEMRDAPFIYLARAKSRRAAGDIDGAKEDEAVAASFDRAPLQ